MVEQCECEVPVYDGWRQVPEGFKTAGQWRRNDRKVSRGEKPAAKICWRKRSATVSLQYHSDGHVTRSETPKIIEHFVNLFGMEQTSTYNPKIRFRAFQCFRRYFAEYSSDEKYLWWNNQWVSCRGKAGERYLKEHIEGRHIYGVVGGPKTRFIAIDLDLHKGDRQIFLDQLTVLLAEFAGKDGWHYQVADQQANGIHFLRVLRDPCPTQMASDELKVILGRLSAENPELERRAAEAGMRSIRDLEVFPNQAQGFRLPLCRGRTMLLDKPLPLRQLKKNQVQDVEAYILWIIRRSGYMTAQDVKAYVEARLRPSDNTQIAPAPRAEGNKPALAAANRLGRVKGRYAKVLVDFWTGQSNPPDSLNEAIRLLAVMLPFYLADTEQAIDLIEQYVDELPDTNFSDRLSSGRRDEVSRVIRKTVEATYLGKGLNDAEASKQKLTTTFNAWQARGFNITDKSTWAKPYNELPMANDFDWTAAEKEKLSSSRSMGKDNIDTVAAATKELLRIIKAHRSELSISLVKKLLIKHGISCGHNGKVNDFMNSLVNWGWIYVRVKEQWHVDGVGRARAYGIGPMMAHKWKSENESRMCSLIYTNPP